VSALMEMPLLVAQELPPPPVRFMQRDSFSREQVTAHEREQSPDLLGAFIRQETPTPNSSVDDLNSGFVIKANRREALNFIKANGLSHILLQSEGHLDAAFGRSSVKTLNIIDDDEGYRTLFCFVAFPGTLADAQAALRSFDCDWWLKNSRRFGSKLNFDFELV
jgi:hypothetical protein